MVNKQIALLQQIKELCRVRSQLLGNPGCERRIFQPAAIQLRKFQVALQVQGRIRGVHVASSQRQALQQQRLEELWHVAAHFQAYGISTPPALTDALGHSRHQIVRLVLGNLHIGISCHAEHMGFTQCESREQNACMRLDNIFERYKVITR